MTRATSKASYLETKEKGQELTQAGKLLEMISLGGDWSMQELMEAYRAKWGNIELSSVSARCNKLKNDGEIIEGHPRKCAISGKIIIRSRLRDKKQWVNGMLLLKKAKPKKKET